VKFVWRFLAILLRKQIPKGICCYDKNKCPFWSMDLSRPSQENGYCYLIGRGDWEIGATSLLWDQCKECGINDDLDEEDLL